MKSKSIVKNIITFGANSRIQKSKAKFESIHEELIVLNTEMEIRKKEVNESLFELVIN